MSEAELVQNLINEVWVLKIGMYILLVMVGFLFGAWLYEVFHRNEN